MTLLGPRTSHVSNRWKARSWGDLPGIYLRQPATTTGILFKTMGAKRIATAIAICLSATSSWAWWVRDCEGQGGTVACIPPDYPAPAQGTFQYNINESNPCRSIGLSGAPRNDGSTTYSVLFINTLDDPIPVPYTGTLGSCVGSPFSPNEKGFWPWLIFYTSYCRDGYQSTSDWVPGTKGVLCVPPQVVDIYHDKPNLPEVCAGNPIYPLTGSKRQTEPLGRWLAGGALGLIYDTRRKVPSSDGSPTFVAKPASSFGDLWESSLHKKLALNFDSGGTLQAIHASRGAGHWVSFFQTYGRYLSDDDVSDRVVTMGTGWLYTDASTRAQESYTSQGALVSVAYASGGGLTYTYSDATTPIAVAPAPGLLIAIQDPHGRAVRFEYGQPPGLSTQRVVRIIDPDQQVIEIGYDTAGNLQRLTWADNAVRQYLYEQSALPWALTGIVDENSERHSTYAYDAQGRAQSTEYAGGVNRYSVSYVEPPSWLVKQIASGGTIWRDHSWRLPGGTVLTTPNGSSVTLGASLIRGMPRVTSRSQPAGAGCDASTSSVTYDANNNAASRTDFNGYKSCSVYDLSRNLEVTRVDGLSASGDCGAVIGDGAALSAGTRKTTTQWHPAWSLPIKQAEPKKITISVYNGQPDPTAGNTTANCAPATALLPDGSPIAVLCRKVEQATTDATGGLGFNATVTGTPRTWTYTYNQYGQMLTARDPLNKLTTYVYYSDTTAEHTTGDLQSVTDAAGRFTQYTRYNKSGRVLQSIDVNGTVTDTTYTPRGWVKTVTVTAPGAVAQASLYDYDGVGQLKKATLPDAMALEYTYDAAHRLTSVKDTAGNSVTYTLDNMGNRTGEDLKDPNGTLARNITRVYDALNRAQSTTGTTQ